MRCGLSARSAFLFFLACATTVVHGQAGVELTELPVPYYSGSANPNNTSVSLWGNRALVRSDTGPAYLFERQTADTWIKVDELVPSSLAGCYSVSLSCDRALVSTLLPEAAYLFERQSNGAWVEVATLTANDGPDATFGRAVSLSGGRALVGSVDSNPDPAIGLGSAYVFERQSSGDWIEVGKLPGTTGPGNDFFGRSVSLSCNRALVGDNNAASVFERQSGGAWVEVATLVEVSSLGAFGFSVSLSGDRALVGAPDNNPTSAAYVFERQPLGAWDEVAKLVATNVAGFDLFGWSVSLSGGRALVGDPDYIGPGIAYMFERQLGAWVEVATLMASDVNTSGFGNSVSLSGARALVGPGFSEYAYLFARSGCCGRVYAP